MYQSTHTNKQAHQRRVGRLASLLFFAVLVSFQSAAAEPLRQQFAVAHAGNTLHVEVTRDAQREGRQPLVIFLVGSGEPSTIANNRAMIDFFLEQPLLPKGYAVAAFDKRGTGKSSGVWYTANFSDRAADAVAVAQSLQQLNWVDPERIYLVGHSQGGWIVQIALADHPDLFAAGISMAGPTFGVREQLINDYASAYQCKHNTTEDKAYRVMSRRVSLGLSLARWLRFSDELKQLNVIKDFTPDDYLTEVTQPLLLLFAENDPLVSPERSIAALNDLFPAGVPENISYYTALGEEHSFKSAPKCYDGAWRDIEFSPATRDYLVTWLTQQNAHK
ncbi:MAG: alpha/beta fold hydrolase [Aliidiomarina sp.]|uniref:alpha/beta hydrolase family protein n=1 Tax=Aliidiomarina sp. TaxID=1872439 RepID=UPI0025C650E4|nr:alpha/beta fold hydrolase [Aliidiomarina sp.]MCH8500734.1 alpha/beta fold hydrolase [Aliidiomarina sp.]